MGVTQHVQKPAVTLFSLRENYSTVLTDFEFARSIMKCACVFDDTAIDLLEKMLELDADKRITAEDALAHKYLAQYADPSDEPVSAPYDQSFEDMDLPVERWKG
jgi:hypothetical protein